MSVYCFISIILLMTAKIVIYSGLLKELGNFERTCTHHQDYFPFRLTTKCYLIKPPGVVLWGNVLTYYSRFDQGFSKSLPCPAEGRGVGPNFCWLVHNSVSVALERAHSDAPWVRKFGFLLCIEERTLNACTSTPPCQQMWIVFSTSLKSKAYTNIIVFDIRHPCYDQ